MPLSDYLRQQAATCQSRATFDMATADMATADMATAERLRFLAADLRAKAEAVEDDGEDVRLHMMQGNGFAGSNGESSPD
jgi:hypothetical protein